MERIDALTESISDRDIFVRESVRLQSWSALLQLRWLWLYRYVQRVPGTIERATIIPSGNPDPFSEKELKDAIAQFCKVCEVVEACAKRTSNEDIRPYLNTITDLVHWVARLEVASGAKEVQDAGERARRLGTEIASDRDVMLLDRFRTEFFMPLIDRLANR